MIAIRDSEHASEYEVQQFVLNKSGVDPTVIAHIGSCSDCQREVSDYILLFSEIKNQPGVSFDFDVQELILSQLPGSKTSLSTDDVILVFLMIFTCSCIAIPVYIFRKIILNSVTDVPPFFIYSITVVTTCVLVIKILSAYRKFLKQIRLLNII